PCASATPRKSPSTRPAASRPPSAPPSPTWSSSPPSNSAPPSPAWPRSTSPTSTAERHVTTQLPHQTKFPTEKFGAEIFSNQPSCRSIPFSVPNISVVPSFSGEPFIDLNDRAQPQREASRVATKPPPAPDRCSSHPGSDK